MTEELYQFLACDYYATGEGRTVYLLITRAYPWVEDYVGEYPDRTVKNTAEYRAAQEFTVKFGGFAAHGVENLTRSVFVERFGHLLPEYVKNILNSDDQPGNFNFAQECHLNFS